VRVLQIQVIDDGSLTVMLELFSADLNSRDNGTRLMT